MLLPASVPIDAGLGKLKGTQIIGNRYKPGSEELFNGFYRLPPILNGDRVRNIEATGGLDIIMNVLLIGSSGSLMESMVNRLDKEGHRIFLLTGSRDRKTRYKHVFEYYRFDFENESVPQVFESVRPDVTLYLGACDPGAEVTDETQAAHFFSGLNNLLVSFSMVYQGRFVYLSTSDIFEGGRDSLISEEDKPCCDTPRALVLTQAEELCASYRNNLGRDVVVLRLDQLYAVPQSRGEVRESCGRLCLEAVEEHAVTCNENSFFSLLYEADAVEFIYRIMSCEEHREGVYNLSSSVPVTEHMLADYIREAGVEATLRESNAAVSGRVLSNKRYREEFGMRFFSDPQKMVERTVRYMQENPKCFEKEARKKSLMKRIADRMGWLASILLPYVENLICFIPFFLLNNWAAGSKYFDRLDFYLLYVLLFAITHGQQQATFSAILATAGYVFRQMYTKSSFEVLSSYNTYVWLAQLFIVGLLVGCIRDKLREQKLESIEEKEYLTRRLNDVLDINRSNVHVKDSLRTQIINQNNSVGKVYEITSSLNQYTTEEVLFHATEIVAKLMETRDVALYMVSNRDYARLISATSDKAKSMGRSVRYRETGDMFDTLSRRQVFINRKLDGSLPMMANAIYDNDEMQIIIMVWGIPWEAMTLGQANLMSVISSLIREAVLRSGRYMKALEDERHEKGTNVLSKEAFSALVRVFRTAHSRGVVDCTILKYSGQDAVSRSEEVRAYLRQSDYLGSLEDGCLYILLPNADSGDAQFVIQRLGANGFEVSIVEEMDV